MATIQKERNITLRGSAQIVIEFFNYGINSILFQRGLYPPEDFKISKKYGLNLLVSSHDGVRTYLQAVLSQLDKWISAKKIAKLVLVISSKDTREVVERWAFDVVLETGVPSSSLDPSKTSFGKENQHQLGGPKPKPTAPPSQPKTEKQINSEIAAVMRQITASVSFLPMLDEPCTFNILAYTDKDAEVPAEWIDSDAKLIARNAEQVRLRSFSTSVHRVDGMVAYRMPDE
ncbi:Mitotic spindle checkpoint component mad2 [Thoreauomyces humboldtii]|nr:Mitotic spindle checkpoint component mad2 [Thoreauomyces humboldtii]